MSNQNTRQQISKKLSLELEQKIEVANRQWGKAKDAVLDVYRQARQDGWTPIEAAKICREKLVIFSPRTIRGILPDEAKNQNMKRDHEAPRAQAQPQIAESLPQNVVPVQEKQPEGGKQQSSFQPAVRNEQPETIEEQFDDYKQSAKSPISIEQEHGETVDRVTTSRTMPNEHIEYVTNEEVRYDSLRALIDNLSGLSQEEQRGFDNNPREMANRTRDYRFKIIKRMSDTDVRMSYGYSKEIYYLLDDFMKQLDDELDVRKAKEKLVSE